jgi:hypothetical protein
MIFRLLRKIYHSVQSVRILGPVFRIIWSLWKVSRSRVRATFMGTGVGRLDHALVKYAEELEKKISTPKQISGTEWPPSAD